MSLPVRSARRWLSAAAFLAFVFLIAPRTTAVETAPVPRVSITPEDFDKAIIAEVKARLGADEESTAPL